MAPNLRLGMGFGFGVWQSELQLPLLAVGLRTVSSSPVLSGSGVVLSGNLARDGVQEGGSVCPVHVQS